MQMKSLLRWQAQVVGCLALSVLLAACAQPTARTATGDAGDAIEVRTSELDPRAYRYVELPNRMRVLLVSDPDTDKSAASLAVRAGSGNNPPTRQGLAHFLEHMLFLGTAKYPDPGEYLEFINAHGGSHNAYTSIDHTNYFFDIDPASLDEALDRFADFFVSPKLDAEYVGREMNAVDSEYNLGLKDDGRREFDVFSEIVNPDHPLAMLAVGNLETLSGGDTDIRDDLIAFYESHYSANLMSLVVVGRDSLDVLERMVRSRFEAVADRNLTEMTDAVPLFAGQSLPQALYIEPEKDLRELSLFFPVPSTGERYESKPMEYIGNLLGHEGAGSLLSVLRQRGWAEGLGAGSGLDFYGQDAFQISIDLTPEGMQHQNEIIALSFAAIDLLRTSGVEGWRFREQGQLSELAFRFREKGSPTGTAIGAANALWEYRPEEVLHGPYAFGDYDAGLIHAYLDQLRPDNLLVTVKHKGVQTDRVSRWFAVPYRLEPLAVTAFQDKAPAELVAQLVLPPANEFVPDSVALKPFADEGATPALIANEAGFSQWYLQDKAFPAPKAAVYLRVDSHTPRLQAADQALAELYTALVRDALTDIAYPAGLAGLGYDVSPTGRGVQLKLSGYDQRQALLLGHVIERMRQSRFDQARFDSLKRELIRQWNNSDRDRPFVQLMRLGGPALAARNWTAAELAGALADRSADDLEAWIRQFYADTSIEMLVHGNHTREEALALGESVRQGLLDGAHSVITPIEIVDLAPGERAALELVTEHPDSAVVYYIQGAGAADRDRALIQLSAQIVSAQFFNSLRTEQQLGYVVAARPMPMYRVPGLSLIVQSANTSASGLETAIEAFLDDQAERAAALDETEYLRNRKALIDALREVPKSQAERTEKLWTDLQLGVDSFDDAERLATLLEAVSLDEWRSYFLNQVTGSDRSVLLIYTRGGANPDPDDAFAGYRELDLESLRAIKERFAYFD